MPDYTIVVFSHLRWDFVLQRPQHLLSRLSARHPVIFIEEPMHTDAPDGFWECSRPDPNVLVCRPRTGLAEVGDFMTQVRNALPIQFSYAFGGVAPF